VGSYFGLGRDTGAMLLGRTPGDRIAYWLAGAIGQPVTLGGDPSAGIAVRDGLVLARVEWRPFGRVPDLEVPYADGPVPLAIAIGINGYYGQLVRSIARFDPITAQLDTVQPGTYRDLVGGADVRLVWDRVSAAAEVDVGRREPRSSPAPAYGGLSASLQFGVFVYRRLLQLAVRGEYLNPSFDRPRAQLGIAEAMLSVYPLGSHLAVLLRYALAYQGPDNALVMIPPGWLHLVTLQVQAYF
jgi:hypothetical protein